jgi:hypothetical protein
MSKANRQGAVYRRKAKAAREASPNCWLCGEPIDLRLKYPHPMSATADHVKALANGGDLLGKMRPAHKVCNERRGNGEHKTDQPKPGGRKPLRSREW